MRHLKGRGVCVCFMRAGVCVCVCVCECVLNTVILNAERVLTLSSWLWWGESEAWTGADQRAQRGRRVMMMSLELRSIKWLTADCFIRWWHSDHELFSNIIEAQTTCSLLAYSQSLGDKIIAACFADRRVIDTIKTIDAPACHILSNVRTASRFTD